MESCFGILGFVNLILSLSPDCSPITFSLIALHEETGADPFLLYEMRISAFSELSMFKDAEKIVDQLLQAADSRLRKDLNVFIRAKGSHLSLHNNFSFLFSTCRSAASRACHG